MGIGEWAALAAALMWTLASMLWGRIRLTALGINLCKNMLGTVLVAVHLLFVIALAGQTYRFAPVESWFWLSLSGLVGVVIGDTFYFRSLQILGPRRALIMATTGPIFSAVLGWIFLKEALLFWAAMGILMTVAGVVVVVADRKASHEAPGLIPGRIRIGVLTGTLGAVCQAVGGVFSKLGMRDADGQEICNALEATFIRLLVAAILTTLVVVMRKQFLTIARDATEKSTFKLLLAATALGTWLGIWLSQIAYNYSEVAVAQTLLSTCPLFAIPIVWFFDKNRITSYSIIGTISALVGIALLVQNS